MVDWIKEWDEGQITEEELYSKCCTDEVPNATERPLETMDLPELERELRFLSFLERKFGPSDGPRSRIAEVEERINFLQQTGKTCVICGATLSKFGVVVECKKCDGQGYILSDKEPEPGIAYYTYQGQIRIECDHCEGRGECPSLRE